VLWWPIATCSMLHHRHRAAATLSEHEKKHKNTSMLGYLPVHR
jgi:hypothetical protein